MRETVRGEINVARGGLRRTVTEHERDKARGGVVRRPEKPRVCPVVGRREVDIAHREEAESENRCAGSAEGE